MGDRVMGFTSVRECTVRKASSFRKATEGNVAMIMAIATIPMLAVMGMAIDYTRAVSARSAMQEAADAAALMVAQDAANLNATQLTDTARKYFNALTRPPA